VNRTAFNFGTILSAGWQEGTLEIEFNSLNVYQYKNVPRRVWDEFKAVDQKANYFLNFIRGQYESKCVKQAPILPGLKSKTPDAT
jgi:hypothetical protein